MQKSYKKRGSNRKGKRNEINDAQDQAKWKWVGMHYSLIQSVCQIHLRNPSHTLEQLVRWRDIARIRARKK
jgi:hypothetical protein